MNLAGCSGQLITCMRPYNSQHPTFTNSCQIGSRKPAVLLTFLYFKNKISSYGRLIKSVIVNKGKTLCMSSAALCTFKTSSQQYPLHMVDADNIHMYSCIIHTVG